METNSSIYNLQDLLNLNNAQISSSEIELKSKLIQWANVANSMQLKMILKKYISFTSQHLHKMDDFLEAEKIISIQTVNPIMTAYIKLIDEKLELCKNPEIKDVCVLAGIQSICHFKISNLGTAKAYSKLLGLEDLAKIFFESEVNEKLIDDELTQLAMFEVNSSAISPLNLA